MKKTTILMINKFFFQKGGAETVFFQEHTFLKNQGYHVIDFAMAHPENRYSAYADFFVPHVDYEKRGSENLFNKITKAVNFIHNREAVFRLSRLIQQEKPHLAHLHNIYHQITPAVIDILNKKGIKTILTLHDYKVICPIYKLRSPSGLCEQCAGKKFWKVIKNRCQGQSLAENTLLAIEAYWYKWRDTYAKVDLFIAPSKFMAERVSRYGVDHKKIKILPNGVNGNFSNKTEDHNYCVYSGRISSEKGIRTLLKAHTKGADELLPLKIIGSGPLLEDLRKEFPLVDFKGFQRGEHLHDLLSKASFIIVPSEWYENCSMSVLEAMAHGKPVIGAYIGGISEQIEDFKSGLLFEMGNEEDLTGKMILLSKNRRLRIKMGKQARWKLEREYALSNHCNKLLNIYDNLINKPGKSR